MPSTRPIRATLILVEPGVYDESVIMWKPVRLQGSGAGSTLINGANRPTEKLVAWRAKMDAFSGWTECTAQPAFGGARLRDRGRRSHYGGWRHRSDAATPARFSQPRRVSTVSQSPVADVGGGIFVNSYADNLEIANNNVFGNNGSYHGGIRVGRPFLELDKAGPYGFNTDVSIHHNRSGRTVAWTEQAVVLSIATGTDGYNVSNNFVCGNFTMGDGGGIGHLGLSDGG